VCGVEAAPEQRADLFVQKVRQCRVEFDFGDPFVDVDEKEVKRAALKELVAFVSSPALRADAFTDPATYAEVFSMVSPTTPHTRHDTHRTTRHDTTRHTHRATRHDTTRHA